MKILEIIKKSANYVKNLDIQKKIILLFIAILVVVNISLGIFLLSTRHVSSVKIENLINEEKSSLYAINGNAKKGIIKNNNYAFFKFSEKQIICVQVTELYARIIS